MYRAVHSFLVGLAGCGPLLFGCQGAIVIDVTLVDRPAEAIGVVVTAGLNNLPEVGSGQSLARATDRFRIQLPESTSGTAQFHFSGRDAAGCEVAAGDGSVDVHGSGHYALTVPLHPQQGCTVEVELVGAVSGQVVSQPAGIDCGTQCRKLFEIGSSISLTATTSERFGGWFTDISAASCAGRVGCTLTVGSGVTKVRANFIRKASCSASGWCAEESVPTLPKSSHLYAIWGSGRDSAWAVGDDGTVLHSDGLLWRQVSSGTTRALRGIWGSSTNDVWAVGELGTLLHFDGTSWRGQSFATTAWLNAVWGTAGDDVWAVGDDGIVLHYDGATWTAQSAASPTTARSLRGIWGSSRDDIWAVGDAGTILHGTSQGAWEAVTPKVTAANLSSVWGTGLGNLWIVGEGGTILQGIGGLTIQPRASGTTTALRAVFGTGTNQVWAVGEGGIILSFTGNGWTSVPTQQPQIALTGIWGSGPQDVWAVAQGLNILRFRP